MRLSDSRDRALLDEEGPPAWLFDPASERIVAANKAALAFFGESSLFALAERSFAPDAPFLVLAREVLADGMARLKHIAFADASAGATDACRVAPMRLPGGGPGLLAELHPWRSQALAPDALRLAEALKALPTPVLLSRLDGGVIFANDAAAKLTGREEGDLNARLGAEGARQITDGLSARSHVSRAFDLTLKGATRRCHVEARRLRDPLIGIPLDLLLLRDITGLAALETVLAAERAKLAELLELAADFTFDCDADGRIIALSCGFRERTGVAAEALIGQRLDRAGPWLIPEDGAASLFAAAPARFDALTLQLTPPGAARIALSLSGRAHRSAEGSFAGYRGVGRRLDPVTAQAAAEAPLARSLAAIVNAAQDTLLVLGGDGKVRFVNAAAEALFGGPRSAIEGKTLAALLTPAARTALTQAPGDALLYRGSESRIRTLDGREKPVRLSVRPIDRAHPQTLCVAICDLSSFKAVEADLLSARDTAEAANRQKSEFLAKVSHELRTPLNAIIGFAEIMRDEQMGPIGNPRYAGYVRDIHHSGHLLLSLINDLIDLAKVESGRFMLKFEPVDVARVVTQAIHLMEPAARSAGVLLDGRFEIELPPVVADERSLEQIVLNLLSNAIKFTARGGKVAVRATPTPEGGVAISVRDTGIGMSAADLKLALEPFKRVNRPDVLEKPGTGLGLPLAKALTEANHAAFRIESEPRAGTAIEIAFPKARMAGA